MKNDISQSPIITVILASHKRLSEELVVLDNAGAPVAAAKLSEYPSGEGRMMLAGA